MRETTFRASCVETPYPRATRKLLINSAACHESRPDFISSSRRPPRSASENSSIWFLFPSVIAALLRAVPGVRSFDLAMTAGCERLFSHQMYWQRQRMVLPDKNYEHRHTEVSRIVDFRARDPRGAPEFRQRPDNAERSPRNKRLHHPASGSCDTPDRPASAGRLLSVRAGSSSHVRRRIERARYHGGDDDSDENDDNCSNFRWHRDCRGDQ